MTLSTQAFTLFSFSLFWPCSRSDSWALTAFYISFFSDPARDRPGIGGLVQTNRRPCGWSRVATRHNKPPSPAQCATASEGPAFLVSWQPNSNMSNSEVRSDGGWELMFSTTWFGQLDVDEMEQHTQRGLCAFVRGITRKANINEKQNKRRNKRWSYDRLRREVCAVFNSC